MRVLCVFGQHNYGDPRRGEGYEFVNFIPALRRLGHEVLFLDCRRRDLYDGFPALNRALLHAVEESKPTVVFSVVAYYEIWLETWRILQDSGIAATVNWATDDSWRYKQFSRLVAPWFDAFTTTCPRACEQYEQDGIHNVLLTQWAASGNALRPPLPARECDVAVSFVGSAHGNRLSSVQALERRGVKVRCWGHGWPQGAVAAEAIPQLIRSSVVSLNFANSAWALRGPVPRRTRQIKARTFEVPGVGGFLLSEWVEGMERYFNAGREIEIFRTADEAAEKVRFYLANPDLRDAIARAGHERVTREHTYESRLARVLEFAVAQRGLALSRRRQEPLGRIDWPRFEAACRAHRKALGLALTGTALKAVCSAAWGRARGARAARRLTYELSWRLAGVRTYSAAGLPGRLFYRES